MNRIFVYLAFLTVIFCAGLSVFIVWNSCISPTYDFDIIIKGGIIHDGALSEPYASDIGIIGDKIVAIQELKYKKAKKIIDARGYIVTPGFIDVHTHTDTVIEKAGWKINQASFPADWLGNYNYIYQGVTTVITGNSGLGITDTGSWLGLIDSLRFGSNVYHLAPHGTIRQELFGKNQPAKLTPAQLEALKKRFSQEMEKGAIGFSTGLEYAPGFLADKNELIEIAKVVKKYGGIYTSHIRDESGNGGIAAIEEAIEIGKESGIAVNISHIKLCKPFKNVTAEQLLKPIEDARKQGLAVTADQYPYTFAATTVIILVPNKYVNDIGIKDEYQNEKGREIIKKELEKKFTIRKPEDVVITFYPEKKSYEGKSLKEISIMEKKNYIDCYLEMIYDKNPPSAIFFGQDENIVKAIMSKDYIMTSSDGSGIPMGLMKPHPRYFGTFPRKIRQYAIEDKVIGLDAAIRSMTSLPAQTFNIKGRGKIAVGYYADIAVIDLKTIKDKATYTDSSQYSEGIIDLLVNGVITMENGSPTNERGGLGLLFNQ